MSIRQDITINWAVSPRIIEVVAPSTELTVQDLYDTIRNISASSSAIDEPEIIDGSGKEVLSATELVGLTVKLLNAKVKFEDRTEPTDCDISGGNLVALDENGYPMNPIQYAPYVTVTYAKSSSATLVQAAEVTTILERLGIPTSPTIADDLDEIAGKTNTISWADINKALQIISGRWKVVNNQMIFYDTDKETPLITFDLKNKQGQPAEKDVFERTPV